MRIINEKLLERMRRSPRCEWCGKAGIRLHPHHVVSRGAGGSDFVLNLIALCPVFTGNNCHGLFHDGHITQKDFLAIVAAREGMLQDEVFAEIWRVINAPKSTSNGSGTTPAGDHGQPEEKACDDGICPSLPFQRPGDRLPSVEADEEGWSPL